MYAFIEGQVCEKGNGFLVILAAGVGWQLNCSNNTLQTAPALGEKMRCHTVLNVRDDAMELFGFATKEEKQMFLQLTSVSGVGSKTALGLLGAMPLRDLNLAILLGDVAALSRAPGIGKTTAQLNIHRCQGFRRGSSRPCDRSNRSADGAGILLSGSPECGFRSEGSKRPG